MAAPSLQMFKSTDPAVEIGTVSVPIDFGVCPAGEVTQLPYNILLFNDKLGTVGSVDAKDLTIKLDRMDLTYTNTSDGSTTQTYTCTLIPLYGIIVKVDGVTWNRVDSFSGYDQYAQVYTCDFVTGDVVFGDNINGLAPVNGSIITRYITPDLNLYGKLVEENYILSCRSFGVVTATQSIDLEVGNILTTSTVQIIHYPYITSVVGVWDNAAKTGTNFFTSGSYNATTGIITLGTTFTGTTAYVEYTYYAGDDNQSAYTTLGNGEELELPYRLPAQNAKVLYLQVDIPSDADTEGGVALKTYLTVTYGY